MERSMSPAIPKLAQLPLTAKALSTMEAPIIPINSAEKMTKKERKAAKKVAKAMDRDKFVTTADILRIAKTLHPQPEKEMDAADANAETVAEDEEIKSNLRFNYSTCNTKSIRQSYITKERSGHHQAPEANIEGLLEQLEVNINAVGKEGELVEVLVKAIKSDLLHFHDEVESTARNKAGFWRWANKKNYRALMDRGKDWDDKHKPIEPNVAGAVEEHRDRELNSNQEGENKASPASSRNSVVPSLIRSASTNSDSIALPAPTSAKPSSSARTPALSLSIPSTPARATKSSPASDSGWTQVGKKVLSARPPGGKITLAANGGLEHLHLKPKGKGNGKFDALSWTAVARSK